MPVNEPVWLRIAFNPDTGTDAVADFGWAPFQPDAPASFRPIGTQVALGATTDVAAALRDLDIGGRANTNTNPATDCFITRIILRDAPSGGNVVFDTCRGDVQPGGYTATVGGTVSEVGSPTAVATDYSTADPVTFVWVGQEGNPITGWESLAQVFSNSAPPYLQLHKNANSGHPYCRIADSEGNATSTSAVLTDPAARRVHMLGITRSDSKVFYEVHDSTGLVDAKSASASILGEFSRLIPGDQFGIVSLVRQPGVFDSLLLDKTELTLEERAELADGLLNGYPLPTSRSVVWADATRTVRWAS